MEFTDRAELAAWLATQPNEVGVAIAARLALRVLPLIEFWQRSSGNKAVVEILLPSLRASAVAWFAGTWPNHAKTKVLATSTVESYSGHIAHAAYAAVRAAAAEDFASYADGVSDAYAGFVAAASDNSFADAQAVAAALEAAISWDVGVVKKFTDPTDRLSRLALWNEGVPDAFTTLWQQLKEGFPPQNDWDVWIDWYERRLNGIAGQLEHEQIYVDIEDDLWDQGPAAVNAHIRRRLAEEGYYSGGDGSLDAPEPAAGPDFDVGNGKINFRASDDQSETDAFDRDAQSVLHEQLNDRCAQLKDAIGRVANQYPGLARVIEDYSEVVSQPLDDLDTAHFWAIGINLMAQVTAFERQNSDGTFTEPMEPDLLAELGTVARLHGGFILGFPGGRELTDKADRARIPPGNVVGPPTVSLLSAISLHTGLLQDRVGRFIDAQLEALN